MRFRSIFSVLALCAPMALAQQAVPDTSASPTPPGATPSPEDKAQIEQILEGEEQVLQGVTSTYDPGLGATRSGRSSRRRLKRID